MAARAVNSYRHHNGVYYATQALAKSQTRFKLRVMIFIRRVVDRHRAYTAIFLPGEEPRVIPTTDYEHGRILQVYKQDRPHADVLNDFTDFGLTWPKGPVE